MAEGRQGAPLGIKLHSPLSRFSLKLDDGSYRCEHVVHLQHLLSGWYIGGAKELEGTSTVFLLQQFQDSNRSYNFLEETRRDMRRIQGITDCRTGERQAGVAQNLEHKSLDGIRDRLGKTLERLTSQ